jgi:hypothetical protein
MARYDTWTMRRRGKERGMARYDTQYWVWYRKPGMPHLTAREFGGQSFPTETAALRFAKAQLRAGFIVECYTWPALGHPDPFAPPTVGEGTGRPAE